MSTDHLDGLLDRLCRGDADAAEQIFAQYEPLLRIVVRRMLPARLRSKFDSSDVVQSIWGDLLRGFRDAGWQFSSAGHLKAFLIKATRNRFLDRQRRHKQQVASEQSLDALPLQALADCQAMEASRGEELWELILTQCPPQYRPLVELRRQGFSTAEIAARTGFHPGSVRRIFSEMLQQMRRHLPADLG